MPPTFKTLYGTAAATSTRFHLAPHETAPGTLNLCLSQPPFRAIALSYPSTRYTYKERIRTLSNEQLSTEKFHLRVTRDYVSMEYFEILSRVYYETRLWSFKIVTNITCINVNVNAVLNVLLRERRELWLVIFVTCDFCMCAFHFFSQIRGRCCRGDFKLVKEGTGVDEEIINLRYSFPRRKGVGWHNTEREGGDLFSNKRNFSSVQLSLP